MPVFKIHFIPSNQPLAGPAMKACILFITGILLSGYVHLSAVLLLALLGLGILVLVLCIRQDRAGSLAASAVLVLAGLCAVSIQQEIRKPLGIPPELTGVPVRVEGRVIDTPRYLNGNTSCILDCRTLRVNGKHVDVSGLLPCTMYGRFFQVAEGASLEIEGSLRRIRRPLINGKLHGGSSFTEHFDYRLAVSLSSPEPVVTLPGKSLFARSRSYLSELIDRYPYGGRRDILRAMTIGDRDGVPAETLTRFATTGIAHVLAVSGLHVGSLCLALWILLAPFPVSRNRKYALILVCLVLYAGICGFRPPVTRSVIMAALAFGTILSERVKNIENSLFIALLIILAFDPQSLFGPSLELSFAAVWTLGMFYPPAAGALKERINLRGVSGYGIRALIISALATAGTAPVLAARFGSLPLYGIFANIPAVLLASIIVPLGMTSIFLTAAGNSIAPLAAVSAFLTGVLLRMLDGITVLVPNLPHASVTTGSISLLTGLGCAGWLYLLSRSHGRSGFKKGLVYIPLVLALVWTWNPIAGAGGSAEKSGTVVFFDVGQGDAALVGYGGKRFFLVDTGPRYGNSGPAETLILPSLKNLGITRLDGIFISHLHDDHTGGLTAILRDMKVDRIFCRASIRDSLALLYGDRVFGLSAGDSIAFHEGGMLVLSPGTNPRLFMNGGTSGENDRSLLLRCDIAETRVLFSGDIEEEVQKVMTAWGPSLSADILKVPHHGAAGLGGGFIHAVGPGLSVISCGANNRYGHPSPQTIQTLAGRNSRIWRTDRDGTMEIHLPGMATGNDESKYFKKIR